MGGALGSVLRYLTAKLAAEWLGPGFPYGTLAVNVIGCFLAGGLFVMLERSLTAPEWRGLLMIGVPEPGTVCLFSRPTKLPSVCPAMPAPVLMVTAPPTL